MQNSVEVTQKIKNRAALRSSNSTSGYLSGEWTKTLIWKDVPTPPFTAAQLGIVKICNQPRCP